MKHLPNLYVNTEKDLRKCREKYRNPSQIFLKFIMILVSECMMRQYIGLPSGVIACTYCTRLNLHRILIKVRKNWSFYMVVIGMVPCVSSMYLFLQRKRPLDAF